MTQKTKVRELMDLTAKGDAIRLEEFLQENSFSEKDLYWALEAAVYHRHLYTTIVLIRNGAMPVTKNVPPENTVLGLACQKEMWEIVFAFLKFFQFPEFTETARYLAEKANSKMTAKIIAEFEQNPNFYPSIPV